MKYPNLHVEPCADDPHNPYIALLADDGTELARVGRVIDDPAAALRMARLLADGPLLLSFMDQLLEMCRRCDVAQSTVFLVSEEIVNRHK